MWLILAISDILLFIGQLAFQALSYISLYAGHLADTGFLYILLLDVHLSESLLSVIKYPYVISALANNYIL